MIPMRLQERLSLVVTIAVTPILAYLAFLSHERLQEKERLFPEIIHPYIKDFLIAIIAFGILTPLRWVLEKIYYPVGYWLLTKYSDKSNLEKCSNRIANCWAMFSYYLFSSVLGWYLLSDMDFAPWWLPGASGNLDKCWSPNDVFNVTLGIKIYYMMTLGWTLSMLLFHVFSNHRRDFLEMLIHHYITIFLVTFSYYLGYQPIGVLIIWTHDFTDIFGFSARSFSDTKLNLIPALLFFGMLGSWGFYRLYVYPFQLVYSVMFDSLRIMNPGAPFLYCFLNILLTLLVCLNYFWYSMFIAILYNICTGKRNDGDIVDKERKE